MLSAVMRGIQIALVTAANTITINNVIRAIKNPNADWKQVVFPAVITCATLAAGTGASHLAYQCTAQFCHASTGTAISTLKGAAKTSATLAKMGGGALCTGGGGIARGKVMCQIIDTGVNAVVNGAAIVTANYYHSESKN